MPDDDPPRRGLFQGLDIVGPYRAPGAEYIEHRLPFSWPAAHVWYGDPPIWCMQPGACDITTTLGGDDA